MKQLKLICIIVLLVFGIVSCGSPSNCEHESLCQRQNKEILNVVAELTSIGQKTHCTEGISEINGQIESVINKVQSSEDLATLASISRAFQVYGSNEAPTCKTSRADNVFDHAFWICVKKLSTSSDSKSKQFLQKIKESSFFDTIERQHFDGILQGKETVF